MSSDRPHDPIVWSMVNHKQCDAGDLERSIRIAGDVDAPGGADRTTALHEAVLRNNTEAVWVLLKYGANVNAVDGLGRTALHDSLLYGRVNITKMLIDKGATKHALSMAGLVPSEEIPLTSSRSWHVGHSTCMDLVDTKKSHLGWHKPPNGKKEASPNYGASWSEPLDSNSDDEAGSSRTAVPHKGFGSYLREAEQRSGYSRGGGVRTDYNGSSTGGSSRGALEDTMKMYQAMFDDMSPNDKKKAHSNMQFRNALYGGTMDMEGVVRQPKPFVSKRRVRRSQEISAIDPTSKRRVRRSQESSEMAQSIANSLLDNAQAELHQAYYSENIIVGESRKFNPVEDRSEAALLVMERLRQDSRIASDVPGDGNCLFTAVADQVNQFFPARVAEDASGVKIPLNQQEIRDAVFEYMDRTADRVKCNVHYVDDNDTRNLHQCDNMFPEWLSTVRTHAWGNEYVIQVIAEIFNVPVRVWLSYPSATDVNTCHRSYYFPSNMDHYKRDDGFIEVANISGRHYVTVLLADSSVSKAQVLDDTTAYQGADWRIFNKRE